MSTGTSPPSGWYANPHGPGHRWWDGNSWTEHVRAAEASPTPTPAPAPVTPAPSADELGASAYPQAGFGNSISQDAGVELAPAVAIPGGATLRSAPAIDPAILIAGLGSLVVFLSLFLPWVGAPGVGFNAFASGLPWLVSGGDFVVIDGYMANFESGFLAHGWIIAVLIVGAITVCWAHFTGAIWSGPVWLAIGAVITLIVLLDAFWMNRRFGDLTVPVGSAWGVIVAVIGAVLIVAAGALVLARDAQRR